MAAREKLAVDLFIVTSAEEDGDLVVASNRPGLQPLHQGLNNKGWFWSRRAEEASVLAVERSSEQARYQPLVRVKVNSTALWRLQRALPRARRLSAPL